MILLSSILHLALCILPLAPGPSPLVTRLDSAYQAGDYERVVQLAPAFLADSARTAADSSAIDRTCAFALVALGRTDEAAAVFHRLLAKDPGLTLNPETVSPKIRAVFESVKAQLALPPSPPAPRPSLPETVYLRRPVPLSVLVPGLHQMKTGRPAAGYALAGATALSLAGLVLSHVEYNNARADYLRASTPQDIADRYQTSDNWSHARVILSGTTIASWLVGLITALRSP
jgi:hypothetical protein